MEDHGSLKTLISYFARLSSQISLSRTVWGRNPSYLFFSLSVTGVRKLLVQAGPRTGILDL
jgi:hypothetical protein